MNIKTIVVYVLLLSLPGLGMASQYEDFTQEIMQPYGFYKKSLALTSKSKNREKAIAVVQKFISSWDGFSEKYSKDIPDRLQTIENFAHQIKRPVNVGEEALVMLKAGQVKQAHMHLEQVRYALWRMRATVGIVSLNDRVNDFHEAMEIMMNGIKEASSADQLKQLGSRYVQWLAIKWIEVGKMSASVTDKKAFADSIEKGESAIIQLSDSLQQGNFGAADKAIGRVKKAYKSIFFLPESS